MYLAAGGAPSPDVVTPGLLGFIVFALLGLALFLLIRSMNRHVRRVDVPADHPEDHREDDERGAGSPPQS